MAVSELRFDPVREDELPMLREWMRRPHVAQWWATPSMEELRAGSVPGAGDPGTARSFIARQGDRPIGFLQCYVVVGAGDGWWEGETDPGARGVDLFLADPAALGRGLGNAVLRAFVERLFSDPAVTTIQADPDPRNRRAIRCYARAGFRPVGEVQTPDGPALLMRCARPAAASAGP